LEIHKPKPWRGFREFLKEYLIIVVGVLTALAAEQAVEWLHWQHKMAELRQGMTRELTADDGPQAWVRLATHDCLERYLDALQLAAEGGAPRREVVVLAADYPAYSMSLFTWDMEGWRALQAGDGAARMSTAELDLWTSGYEMIPPLQQYAADERQAIAALQGVRPAAGSMTASELESLARTVQRLRADNDWMTNYAAFLLSSMTAAGLKLPAGARPQMERSHTMGRFRALAQAHGLAGCERWPDPAKVRPLLTVSSPLAAGALTRR
jgi:hypothetical protein